jgi:hypothetical protein
MPATASGTNARCGINPRDAYARQRGYQGSRVGAIEKQSG